MQIQKVLHVSFLEDKRIGIVIGSDNNVYITEYDPQATDLNLAAFNNTSEIVRVVESLPDGPYGNPDNGLKFNVDSRTGEVALLWDDDETGI